MNRSFKRVFLGLCTIAFVSFTPFQEHEIPSFLRGEFEDDYGVHYSIDAKTWQLLPDDKYHVLQVNVEEGYLIFQNDSQNSFAPGLFTRIDYQSLTEMPPYEWAFCFSNFEAASETEAMQANYTQKTNLKTGCNGFPFSRMKRRN